MKKTTTLSIIAFMMLIGFTACSDKDKDGDNLEGEQKKEALIGKWAWKSMAVDGSTADHQHFCDTQKDHWEFKANNQGNEFGYDQNCEQEPEAEFTYTVTGNKIKVTGDYIIDGTFEISGNILTINFSTEVGPGSPLFPHTFVFERL